MDALQIVEGQDYVTLYTCTPYGVNTHRLLVRGHRIETPENVNLGNGAVDIIRTQSGMTVLITLAVVGLLILLFLHLAHLPRPQEKAANIRDFTRR